MKRYKVRLEDPESKEFRIVNLNADSPQAAQAACEEKERKMVAFSLDEDEIKDEQAASERRGRVTGRLFAHYQGRPFEVVSVDERAAARESAGDS